MLLAAAALIACDGDTDGATPAATADATAEPTATIEGSNDPDPDATPTPIPPVTPSVIPDSADVEPETGDWAQANGGHRNTRARESEITEATVDRLEEAWRVPFSGRGPYGAAAGAPVIADGVAYMQDLGGGVIAVDLETGDHLWEYDDGIPVSGPNGPAVADGRVFVSAGSERVVALDAEDGEVLWDVPIEKDGFQPVVYGDMVLVGTGALAHVAGQSGFVHALDVATGAALWSFQVIEEGFWGDEGLNSGGGVWMPPAIDPVRGLAYFGTGNAGPYPGTVDYPNGESRPGDNLYTSSMVALDLQDGSVQWHYQAVPHGLFDHDFHTSPIIVSLTFDGEAHEVAIGSGKLGRITAIDLESHEVIWDTPVGTHQNDELDAVPPGEVIEVYPGIFGGVETPMAAAGDRVFAAVVNLPTRHTSTGHGALDGSSALLNAAGATNFALGEGELVALDVGSGEVLWTQPLAGIAFGGATVVGDLVFTGTYNGVITAHRITDGEEVWRLETGGINAWPAVSADGATIVWPIGLGGAPHLLALRLADIAP
ncbi:MAG: PQQ-binding-like beta-propeller repeat protein, partial [Dehalococcoidia bacterium]